MVRLMKKCWLFLIAVMVSLQAGAQTEFGSQGLPDADDQSRKSVELPMTMERQPQLLMDSMSLALPPAPPSLSNMNTQGIINTKGFAEQSSQGGTAFRLWKGANIGFYGSNYHLPGLMNTSSGSMVFHQDLGRWHFTASGEANKYWMPWQRSLFTQYGFGGTVGYDVSEALSLHAFGYYYANQMQVGPAMTPYMNSTTFGGYANIRFSQTFGANLGARRYVDPMTGQWETVPIINPYINIGGGRLEFPLGDLLKHLVWDRNDKSRQRAWEEHFNMNMNPANGFSPSSAPMAQPPKPVRPPIR